MNGTNWQMDERYDEEGTSRHTNSICIPYREETNFLTQKVSIRKMDKETLYPKHQGFEFISELILE